MSHARLPSIASLVAILCFSSIISPVQANSWNALKEKGALKAFSSENELNQWLQRKKEAFEKNLRLKQYDYEYNADIVAKAPPAQAQAEEAESVTNTQTAGVDEGGIVKVHGHHLVILRRGRLFTVDIQDDKLRPVSAVDAFAPGTSGDAWYDEMLVSENTVLVIGYSYQKQGTEIVLFDIDQAGELSYRSTYVLRSNDYYSSRNYASRLIGSTLIFYTPLFLDFYRDPLNSFPAIRHWQGNQPSDFIRLAPATKIYRADDDLDPVQGIALHTVHICELAVTPMTCTASAILAPPGHEFYVSRDAVFIWTAPYRRHDSPENADTAPPPPIQAVQPIQPTQPALSAVFRLPLDTTQAPASLKALGSPIDQFSFLESEGYLNVLLRAEGPSASMWASEIGSRNLALLRVNTCRFGDGTASAPIDSYHPLPAPEGGSSLQNRYIGDYLVVGAGETWRRSHRQNQEQFSSYILNWKIPEIVPARLPVEHSVDRIEALGETPLLIGSQNGNLRFSAVSAFLLSHESKIQQWNDLTIQTTLVSDFTLKGAAQGETRSHGFFYKANDENNGILGLPFRGSGAGAWRQLKKASNGIIYLRNRQSELSELGILAASPPSRPNDHCKASCVDWYGNSRPLFVKNRIFALMGYELVEGNILETETGGQRIMETRRIDFMPKNNRK